MWLKFFVFVCVVGVAVCNREGRFFSFNFEDRDITVDLDFSIPFISIPIKKTVDSYGTSDFPTVNINPASLVLGGAVVLGTTILLPILMKSYTYKTDYRYSRILDNTDFSADKILGFVNNMWTDGRGVRGCTLRVACWTAKQKTADTSKIMDFIVNNKLLSTVINATAIEDAMLSGRHGRDCMSYTPCPIHEEQIPIIIKNFANLLRPHG